MKVFIQNRINQLLARMFIALLAVGWYGCTSNPLDVDISGVQVELQSSRLDRDLFHAQDSNFKRINQQLFDQYGEFYRYYLEDIIAIGSPQEPMIAVHVERFATDPNWREVQVQIDQVFADMTPYLREFEQAFRYHRYHFPSDTIPEIIFYNSGFNVGVYPEGKYLGIGLEWFLGTQSPVIQRLAPESFPQYFKDKLKPELLVNNAIRGFLMVKHQQLLKKEDLINMMIFHGKIMYLMDALFPEVSDEVKMNYRSEELEWCRKNEYNMWVHLIDANLLYTTNAKDLAGFINDGPFTPAFQQASPARTGVWLGWQMIRQYMNKNKDVTLKELLQEDNPQKILRYYKP